MDSHSIKNLECHQTASGFSSIVGVSVIFLVHVQLDKQTAFERPFLWWEHLESWLDKL